MSSPTSVAPAAPAPTPPLEYPSIIPGGSLIIAYQIHGKEVLIIGGGNVAASRLYSVLCAEAHVTLIAPHPLHSEIQHRLTTHAHQITHIARPFSVTDDITPQTAPKYSLVLAAIDDPATSTRIYTLCHNLRIPVNIADVPSECDFYFGSIHRDGPLQIMVSTNGNGPKLANLIRRKIADVLPPNVGEAITKVGMLRRKLRKVAPGIEDGPKRMEWMTKVSEGWTLEELGGMGEEEMERLLENWAIWKKEGGEVPSYEKLIGKKKEEEIVEEVVASASRGGWFGSLGWF